MSRIPSPRHNPPRTCAVLALVAIALLLPARAPAQATPDDVVAAWQDALVAMDYDAYEILLHADYHFYSAGIEGTLNRDLDLASTFNMLSGLPCQTDGGGPLPPVLSISCPTLLRLNTWEETPPGDPFLTGSLRALYQYGLVLHLEGDHTMTASGEALYYVVDDGLARSYALIGLQDLGAPSRTNEEVILSNIKELWAYATVGDEAVTWGEIKTLYTR